MQSIQDKIAIDILSSEIQFDLLKQTPCEYLGDSSLAHELDSLGSRLSYLENARGADDAQVVQLKVNYSLLEIKDFILMQSMSDKCKIKPTFVLYFYSNKGDCSDCQYMGSVLTALRQEYPDTRVYSFDYRSNISAVRTLESIYRVQPQFPALVIHGKPAYGLKSLSDLKGLMPELKTASSTATTTTAPKK